MISSERKDAEIVNSDKTRGSFTSGWWRFRMERADVCLVLSLDGAPRLAYFIPGCHRHRSAPPCVPRCRSQLRPVLLPEGVTLWSSYLPSRHHVMLLLFGTTTGWIIDVVQLERMQGFWVFFLYHRIKALSSS